jgi:hypothetical protein
MERILNQYLSIRSRHTDHLSHDHQHSTMASALEIRQRSAKERYAAKRASFFGI